MLQDPILNGFAQAVFANAYQLIHPHLMNFESFSAQLNQRIKVKEHGNEQFEFDVALDGVVLKGIRSASLAAQVFSEESGWQDFGGHDYTIEFDPLCNSSLASRTFLDAAMGLTIFDGTDTWLASLVMDYQTGIVGVAQSNGAQFWAIASGHELTFVPTKANSMADAWVVLTLENRDERAHMNEAAGVVAVAKRLISSSGHIYWLRLAEGTIDAYADPFGGEELYEMFACMLAIQSGCVVTDRDGKPFDPTAMLKTFRSDRHFRFYPVAAQTPALHAELLASLRAKA